jgi:hypothetical protein
MVSQELKGRDSQAALLLGGFLAVFSLPVLAGGLIAQLGIDRWLSLLAGLVLLLVGAGLFAWGWRRRPRAGAAQ